MNFKNTKEIYCNIKSKATTALQFKILKYFLSSITTEEVIKLFWENENDPDLYDFLKKIFNLVDSENVCIIKSRIVLYFTSFR